MFDCSGTRREEHVKNLGHKFRRFNRNRLGNCLYRRYHVYISDRTLIGFIGLLQKVEKMAAKELVIDGDLLQQYMGITGAADEIAAQNMLEACNGDLQMAVNMFLEAHGSANQIETQSFGEASTSIQTSTSALGSRLQPISRLLIFIFHSYTKHF